MKKNTSERLFKCCVCGEKMTAYKKTSRQTKEKHIKHMYCYKCKHITPFTQISKYGDYNENLFFRN